MRGVSFESFIGPGVSALKSCMPPTPSSGRIATVSTMMPMPPIQCMRCRQMLIDGASASRPLIVVEPVVVRPEVASKKASVKDMPRPSSISGSAPTAGISVQASTTSMMPSRMRISRRKRRVANQSARPPTKQSGGARDETGHAVVAAREREHERRQHRDAEHHHDGREHVDDREDGLAQRELRLLDQPHPAGGRAELHAWNRRPTAATCRRSVRKRITWSLAITTVS